ncbi:unnamed protein product [Ectocarpus sp. 6 AP-2014]
MASPYTLTCEAGFLVAGMQEGENYLTPIRVLSTLIAVSVVSAWCNRAKIKRLSLFFSHWLSGAVLGLSYLTEDVMVSSCFAASNLLGLIKFIKFLELAAANMLAVTNLGICINLSLIVSSHRTMTRVKTVSSPGLLFLSLLVSVALSAATVPLWETALVLGTGFWFTNPDPEKYDLAIISIYVIESFVGICMLGIVSWLLTFRMKEIKECWEAHIRIRYYFGLTLFGTAVNLGLGICGVVYIIGDRKQPLLQIWSWLFRYIHIAVDTFVLYGVLQEGNIDERGGDDRSSQSNSHNSSGQSDRLSNKPRPGGGYTSKPTGNASAPMV